MCAWQNFEYESEVGPADIRNNSFYKKAKKCDEFKHCLVKIDAEISALHTFLEKKTEEDDNFVTSKEILKEKERIRRRLNIEYEKICHDLEEATDYEGDEL